MKIYIVADPQGNEIYRNTNFYAAVKKAIEHGFEYVVEYDHDHRGNLIKTILGWNACVVSYNVAVKLFAGNAQVLKKLEEM